MNVLRGFIFPIKEEVQTHQQHGLFTEVTALKKTISSSKWLSKVDLSQCANIWGHTSNLRPVDWIQAATSLLARQNLKGVCFQIKASAGCVFIINYTSHNAPVDFSWSMTAHKDGQSFWVQIGGQHRRERNLHFIVWPAGTASNGCKMAKNNWLSRWPSSAFSVGQNCSWKTFMKQTLMSILSKLV